MRAQLGMSSAAVAASALVSDSASAERTSRPEAIGPIGAAKRNQARAPISPHKRVSNRILVSRSTGALLSK